MSTAIPVRPATDADIGAIRDLILPIQREEFGVAVTWEDQPDLHDLGVMYGGVGGFWVAVDGDAVVGSIALHDCGDGLGALRKMFVRPSHRGRSADGTTLAASLLDHLLAVAQERGFTRILLGTTDRFLAAQRFYEKHGFTRTDERSLPPSFPRMAVDTVFFERSLG